MLLSCLWATVVMFSSFDKAVNWPKSLAVQAEMTQERPLKNGSTEFSGLTTASNGKKYWYFITISKVGSQYKAHACYK